MVDVFDALESIAPLRLAGSWDNVGLLIEGTRPIRRVGVAIDLTAPVVDELLSQDVDLIVSYHPPIFGGLKRLTAKSPRSLTLLSLIRAGVHVYSPHSALDAAADGMADWLLEPLGSRFDVAPIEPDVIDPKVGAGRRVSLAARPLGELVEAIRNHLGLEHVRVAGHPDQLITHAAVCPGAGGSLFSALSGIDLFVTGEMRHHDVLARLEEGSAVVLTDHTNCERGFLPRFASRLGDVTGLKMVVSRRDADPLQIWSSSSS